MRERGLKYVIKDMSKICVNVVPYAGTWIEIYGIDVFNANFEVVPYLGMWIEIMN